MYGQRSYGRPYNPHVEETKKKMSPMLAIVALCVLGLIFAIPSMSSTRAETPPTIQPKRPISPSTIVEGAPSRTVQQNLSDGANDHTATLATNGVESDGPGYLRANKPRDSLLLQQQEDYSKQTDFTIRIISDLDQQSKEGKPEKPSFHSLFVKGILHRDLSTNQYSIQWEKQDKLVSKHNEAGRGMELSELIMYNQKMYSVEDRTGIVYEIMDFKGESPYAVPRIITTEGDGNTDKGMKLEWATVKDGELVLGSFGKEYTASDGSIINRNNLWVIILDKWGGIRHEDWSENFMKLRKAAGAAPPGYMIHEAIMWSTHLNRWVVLPRRVSAERYDEVEDEKKGSNMVMLCSEDFNDIHTVRIGNITPERGFSTFKFVPGTKDQVVVAIKSEENAEEETQSSYAVVFNLNGEILMEETEIPGGVKYEGLEFVL
mmetsp:Transcript_2773/g.3949  ORF Transcript_2773/g.3949 Transcript_2773/m.3949 type:complete len:432 (+) Transcript_2773:106-1401(+)